MKISEMTNEQASEALIRLSVPFGNICDDEKITELIEKYRSMTDKPFIHTIGKMIPEIVAYAFKTHKQDMYEIVGALTGSTVEKVRKMNFLETVKVLKESYDEVLKDFFTSSVKQMKNTADGSSQT